MPATRTTNDEPGGHVIITSEVIQSAPHEDLTPAAHLRRLATVECYARLCRAGPRNDPLDASKQCKISLYPRSL